MIASEQILRGVLTDLLEQLHPEERERWKGYTDSLNGEVLEAAIGIIQAALNSRAAGVGK